jgi:arylsulfatase
LLAAAGDPNIKDQLLKGTGPGGNAHKVHLDGYNILPYLEGAEAHSPRQDFYYFDDDGQLVAMRHQNWKFVFCEQRAPGNMLIWANPFTCLRLPKIYNLRMDPYERADITSDQYYDWIAHNAYLAIQGQIRAIEFMETFKDYPPSQAPASFSIDPEGILKMLERQKAAVAGGK